MSKITTGNGAKVSAWQQARLQEWAKEKGIDAKVTVETLPEHGQGARLREDHQRLDGQSKHDFFQVTAEDGRKWAVRVGQEGNIEANEAKATRRLVASVPIAGDALQIAAAFFVAGKVAYEGRAQMSNDEAKFAYGNALAGAGKLVLSALAMPVRLGVTALELCAFLKDKRDARQERNYPVVTVAELHGHG